MKVYDEDIRQSNFHVEYEDGIYSLSIYNRQGKRYFHNTYDNQERVEMIWISLKAGQGR